MKQQLVNRESGNVLFLILIAVALFAALSYAVTQSTRSGGGSTEREQSLLGSATLTQYPTALRTAVIRLILAGNDVRVLSFDGPSDFASYSTFGRLVFHPDGGGAVFQQAPGDVMAAATAADWYHNANFHVPLIGRDLGATANDVIAFVVGVNEATCARINDEMGFATTGECGTYEGTVPEIELADNAGGIQENLDGTNFATGPGTALTCAGGSADAFDGKATGCFYDTSLAQFVFYSVILER